MEEVDAYLKVLDVGYFEVQEAFKGLTDENVWKRPAPGLLSVGELAGHIAYWEAMRLAGEGGEPVSGQLPQSLEIPQSLERHQGLDKCQVKSLLVDPRFGYYPATIAASPSEQHLAMTALQVCQELVRVHEEAVAHFKELRPDLESHPPGWPLFWNYGDFLRYLAFHVAYHTGQIYSARHLLGEETPDN